MEMSTGADSRARSTRVLARECSEDLPFSSLLLLLCHPFISSMVSSLGLLLQYNRFHLPVKPPGRPRSGTKDSERENEKRGQDFFFTPIQTHPLPALSSSHSPSSEQIKMLRSHFSLSVQEIIIQTDFWTASCTIRNSAALGRKM